MLPGVTVASLRIGGLRPGNGLLGHGVVLQVGRQRLAGRKGSGGQGRCEDHVRAAGAVQHLGTGDGCCELAQANLAVSRAVEGIGAGIANALRDAHAGIEGNGAAAKVHIGGAELAISRQATGDLKVVDRQHRSLGIHWLDKEAVGIDAEDHLPTARWR